MGQSRTGGAVTLPAVHHPAISIKPQTDVEQTHESAHVCLLQISEEWVGGGLLWVWFEFTCAIYKDARNMKQLIL